MSSTPGGTVGSRIALFVPLLIEVSAMEAASTSCVVSVFVVPSASIRCNRSNRSCSTSSRSLSSAPRPQRLVSLPSSTSASPSLLSLRQAARPTSLCCQASSGDVPAATEKAKSILCTNCEGNGAVVCSQCKGEGLNSQDYFGGRFKAGTICWLCSGTKQMLCGSCNGAGFMGGFLNTQDE